MQKTGTFKRFATYAFILVAGLLLSGCTIPKVCSDGGVHADFTTLWTTWQGVIATGVLVIFLVSGLVYILAGLIAHRGLIVWAKNQIYEGFVTLIFALFAMSLVGFVCSTDISIVGMRCPPGSSSCNAFDAAYRYLDEFSGDINTGFILSSVLNFVVAGLSTLTFGFAIAGIGLSLGLGNGLTPLKQVLSNALVAIVTAKLIIVAQMMLLKISERIFSLLLPAGIILRSFGITRGFGGALIAIALGFYFIYPLSIVYFYGTLLGYGAEGLSISERLDELRHGQIPQEPTDDLSITTFVPICGFIGLLIVGSLLVPFLTFIIVVSFVKGLSGTLGEEVDVSNLTRLV